MAKVIKSTETIIKTLYDFRFDKYSQLIKEENGDYWLYYLINHANELNINVSEYVYKGNLIVEFIRNNDYNNPETISVINNPKIKTSHSICIDDFDTSDCPDIDMLCVFMNERILTIFIPIMEKLLYS